MNGPTNDAVKGWQAGGRRACSPTATWTRLEPLLPVFGISRVANITGLDRIGIPVFTAVRPNARSLSVYQGKGLTVDAARVSAVMEAYETWCAETIDAPLKFASLDELRFTHPLVDTDRLPLSAIEGLDPDLPFLWIEGTDLVTGTARWVPFEMVHANYALPEPPHSGALPATTNGLASGNTRDEAVLHALMEVIERDAMTLWKLGPDAWGNATAIRPETVTAPTCRWLLDQFSAAAIDVAMWDIRSDLGVPACMVLIQDQTGETGTAELGAGAHPAPEVALVRALTEAAQARGTFIAGAREDIPDADYTPEALADRKALSRQIFQDHTPQCDFAEIAGLETDSFRGDIDAALERLSLRGVNEVIAVDLGKRALPFAVVRVIVPGLEAAFEGPDTPYVPGARASALLTELGEHDEAAP